jgi:hypothetical protein
MPDFIGLRTTVLKCLSGGLFLSILVPTSNHLGDLSGLNSSELALREIRFLSRFIGVTKWFFSSDLYINPMLMCITQVAQKYRPLPKRLEPQETWETWIRVAVVPNLESDEVWNLARARLSTGEIVRSHYNDGVPTPGTVPGGPITKVAD